MRDQNNSDVEGVTHICILGFRPVHPEQNVLELLSSSETTAEMRCGEITSIKRGTVEFIVICASCGQTTAFSKLVC